MNEAIRVVVLAAIGRPGTGEFLVFTGRDEMRGLVYDRPFGGGLEFGETVSDAVRREVKEEIGIDITAGRILGVTESFFTVGDHRKHEVAVIVEAEFVDPELYKNSAFPDQEGNNEHGSWRRLDATNILFPEKLPAILKQAGLVS
ncbi:NUDIX domain-containing protein [Rhizobium sp. C1]|uniref:NUDIX domain-containing protein n=1 Tax=Rhizobium sp. C1 TaxID=1349799 RepID=UPI001E37B14E|nr:NUDIX domain-containing protein [Rhizobium sp. C1]MCD2177994.1 NUDIX domain-containing protein [Rhizobium sp. C1]